MRSVFFFFFFFFSSFFLIVFFVCAHVIFRLFVCACVHMCKCARVHVCRRVFAHTHTHGAVSNSAMSHAQVSPTLCPTSSFLTLLPMSHVRSKRSSRTWPLLSRVATSALSAPSPGSQVQTQCSFLFSLLFSFFFFFPFFSLWLFSVVYCASFCTSVVTAGTCHS